MEIGDLQRMKQNGQGRTAARGCCRWVVREGSRQTLFTLRSAGGARAVMLTTWDKWKLLAGRS